LKADCGKQAGLLSIVEKNILAENILKLYKVYPFSEIDKNLAISKMHFIFAIERA